MSTPTHLHACSEAACTAPGEPRSDHRTPAETLRERRVLREALIGSNGHLYRTSAHFKHAVDTFADALPVFGESLAAAARTADATAKQVEAMIRTLPPAPAPVMPQQVLR